jgi:protein-tyrosine phosphatase
MFQRIFWIECGGPGRLAILSRPAQEWLREEVAAWRDADVTIVASLLESQEQRELGLGAEADLCRAHGIDFASFPIQDRGIPASPADAVALARRLANAIANGGTVGVHCRAGIGRSGMIAACVLMALGHSEDHAFEAIAAGRGLRVPDTPEQRDWVGSVAQDLARPVT